MSKGITYLFPRSKLKTGGFWEYTDEKSCYMFFVYDYGTKLCVEKDDVLVDMFEITDFDNIEETYIAPYILARTNYVVNKEEEHE